MSKSIFGSFTHLHACMLSLSELLVSLDCNSRPGPDQAKSCQIYNIYRNRISEIIENVRNLNMKTRKTPRLRFIVLRPASAVFILSCLECWHSWNHSCHCRPCQSCYRYPSCHSWRCCCCCHQPRH